LENRIKVTKMIRKYNFIDIILFFTLFTLLSSVNGSLERSLKQPEFIEGSFTVIFEKGTDVKDVSSKMDHIQEMHTSNLHPMRNGVVSKKFSRAFQVRNFV